MQKTIAVPVILALMLPAMAASAKLYKCEDASGEISYTDQPCENEGKELKLPPLTTYTPVIIPNTSEPSIDPAAAKKTIPYKSLEILAPENDKLILTNTGTVTISFKVNGPLQTLEGHKFAIAVDGTQLKSRGVTNQIRLDNVGLGTHTVQVYVVDSKNQLLKTSETVTFHIRRKALTKRQRSKN